MPYERFSRYLPTEPRDLCGPTEFAACVVGARGSDEVRGHLDDLDVAKLISIAHACSLWPEEGRYPRFRLFAYKRQQENDELRTYARLDERVPLTAKTLRKLAPAVTGHGLSLVVSAHGGDLMCHRMISVGLHQYPMGEWQAHGGPIDMPDGLMVRVDGPGELTVTEQTRSLSLKGGRVRELTAYSVAPQVHQWLAEVSDSICSETGVDADAHARARAMELIRAVWGDVLRGAQNQRHGALYVVTPQRVSDERMKLEWRVGMDLRLHLANHLKTCRDSPARPECILRSQGRIRRLAEGLSALGNVDGCVSLTRGLEVCGFGGVIKTEGGAPGQLLRAMSGENLLLEDPSLLGGTRHQSAYRLCHALPGTLAFVVSQDGDLRLFCGAESGVYAYDCLSPQGTWSAQ